MLNVIRGTKKIQRLVFVACNFEASYKNIVHLAKTASKQTLGFPFLPVKVIPVDLFPHTLHFEVIIYLERCAPDAEILKDITDTAEVLNENKDGAAKEGVVKKEVDANLPQTSTGKSPAKSNGAVQETVVKKVNLVEKYRTLFASRCPNQMISKQAKRKRNRLMERKHNHYLLMKHKIVFLILIILMQFDYLFLVVLLDAYSQAMGIDDTSKVDAREIVKLFARNVTLEEFASFINRTLPKPQKIIPPAPFVSKQPAMRSAVRKQAHSLMQMNQQHHNVAARKYQVPFEQELRAFEVKKKSWKSLQL